MEQWRTMLKLLLLLCWSHSSTGVSQRNVLVGDFDGLNGLIKGAVIRLPDFQVSQNLVSLYTSNLLCKDFAIGDISLSVIDQDRTAGRQTVTVELNIEQLDMTCEFDYRYDTTIVIFGKGSAEVLSNNNAATIRMVFSSPNFDTHPPESLIVESCEPKLSIDDMNFRGGIVAFILDIIESRLRNALENLMEETICQELDSMATTNVAAILILLGDKLREYPANIQIDSLAAEKALVVPPGKILIDFWDKDTGLSKWANSALEEAISYLGADAEDPNGWRESDMNINILLRNHILQDGALVVNISDLPFAQDGKLWEGHDRLTQTAITLNSVRLLGLDTLRRFEPLAGVGNYTIRSGLSWEYLTFDFDITIDIKPSSLEDSFITNPGSTTISEKIKIKFGIENLGATIAILLAIDQEKLEELQLGSLLDTNEVLPCFISTIFEIAFSSFSVDAGNIQPPILEGFVSLGIDRIVSDAIDGFLIMYEAVLLEAVPSFFHTTVRELIQKKLSDTLDSRNDECSMVDISNDVGGAVDLRDLLLTPNQALAAGGSGMEQYGSVISSFVMPYITEKIFETDQYGSPGINSRVIRPLSKLQSGTEGLLKFPSDLIYMEKDGPTDAFWSWLFQKMEFRVFDTRLQNIDTFTTPFSLLNATKANKLTSKTNMGQSSSRPLNATFRLEVSIDGQESPFRMRNELDISFSTPASTFLIDFLANIGEKNLMEFPLKDFANYNCWLASLVGSQVHDIISTYRSNMLRTTTSSGLSLSNFSVDLSLLNVGITCVTCTAPIRESLADIVPVLQRIGLPSMIHKRFDRLLEDIVLSSWNLLQMDIRISEAPTFCPHNAHYDAGAVPIKRNQVGIRRLQRESIEMIVTFGSLMVEMALVFIAKSHLLQPPDVTHPLSVQDSIPYEANVLDWTDLDASFGDWADLTIRMAIRYISTQHVVNNSNKIAEDLGANILMRNFLLDDDEKYVVQFTDIRFEGGGIAASVSKVEIHGLDSMSKFSLKFIGPQTIQSIASFEKLTMNIHVDIDHSPEDSAITVERMVFSFNLHNIVMRLALLVAIDLDEMGDIQLGGILNIDDIFSCILSSVRDASISQLLVEVGSLDEPTVKGFVSDELEEFISSFIQNSFGSFRSDLVSALPIVFDTTVRSFLNSMLASFREQKESFCSWKTTKAEMIDFRDLLLSESPSRNVGGSGMSPYGDLFSTVAGIASKEVSINDILTSLTKSQSNIAGSLVYEGDLVNSNSMLSYAGLQANIELKVSDIQIRNINSFGEPFQVLQPISENPQSLGNIMSLGVDSRPLYMSAKILIALSDNDELQLRNELRIDMSLSTITIFFSILIKMSQLRLFSFPLRDIQDINCWLATIMPPSDNGENKSIQMPDYEVWVEDLDLNITCVSCTSPSFDKFAQDLYLGDKTDDTNAFINYWLEKAVDLLTGDFAQDKLIADAAKQCPHSLEYEANATTSLYFQTLPIFKSKRTTRDEISVYFNAVSGLVALFFLALFVYFRHSVWKRNGSWIESLSTSDLDILRRQQELQRNSESAIDQTTESLFRSSYIPRYLRYAVPIAFLFNNGLYLGGQLGILCTIGIEGQIAGEEFAVNRFLDYRFLSSTLNTYNNGGKEMAILVWIFVGIYPHIKMLLLMTVWFLSPHRLSSKRRHSILMWLHVFAKLSTAAIFILLISVASILVYIGGPDEAVVTDGEEFYEIKVSILPRGGIYALFSATLLSSLCSGFVLFCHEQIVKLATDNQWSRSETEESYDMIEDSHASNDDFEDDEDTTKAKAEAIPRALSYMEEGYGGHGELWRRYHFVRSRSTHIVIAVAFTFVTITVIGIIGAHLAPAMTLEVTSLLEIAVDSGKGFAQAASDYGLFEVVIQVLLRSRFATNTKSDYIGLGFLLAVAIISHLIPTLVATYINILEWSSQRRSERRPSRIRAPQEYKYLEEIHMWRHMEMYVVAFVLASWQLAALSQYAIHTYCETVLGQIYDTMIYIGLAERTSTQCFQDQVTYPSFIISIIGGFLILLLSFIFQAAVQYRKNKAFAQRLAETDDSGVRLIAGEERSDLKVEEQNMSYPALPNSTSEKENDENHENKPIMRQTSRRPSLYYA